MDLKKENSREHSRVGLDSSKVRHWKKTDKEREQGTDLGDYGGGTKGGQGGGEGGGARPMVRGVKPIV